MSLSRHPLTTALFLLLVPLLAARPARGQEKEGKDEAWALLYQYLEMSVPQPDGGKLTKESRSKVAVKMLYHDEDAKEAKRLEERPLPGLENKIAPFVKTHILRLRLADISAVRSDDLPAFLKSLAAPPPGLSDPEKAQLEALKKGEGLDKLPKKGWIVEVRGYTYHHKGPDFIKDTLLENLADPEGVHLLGGEMQREIKDRLSFVMLYQAQTVKEGEEEMGLIKKSPLKALAESGKLGKDLKALDKLHYKMPTAKRGKDEPALARTEFSLVFLWSDPEVAKKE